MYRNSEGYASPTEGAAYAHIIYEERMMARKCKKQNQTDRLRTLDGENPTTKVRMTDTPDTIWILAWSRNSQREKCRRCTVK